MIFLIAAAALCMGGIVAYLAREKGRSPLTWAIYGTVAAPIALPHILIVNPLEDADDDVWAEIRDTIQSQSVNDQRPIMNRAAARPSEPQREPQREPRREPQAAPAAPRREAPLHRAPAPSVAREAMLNDLDRSPKPDAKAEPRPGPNAEPRLEPKHDMFADKRHPSAPAPRAEPSFGPAAPSTGSAAAGNGGGRAANDFVLSASDRIGATHAAPAPTASGDMRMRAPLSIDPDAERAESRPIAGKLFAFGAVAVAIAAGFFVLGPTLARLVPAQFAFWAQPEVKEVKNTAPTNLPGAMTPSGPASGAAPGAAAPNGPTYEALPGGNTTSGDAKEVGTAKFGGPIKSDPKAPAYQGSGAAPVDLGMATRGMKPVEVPQETKSEPKSEPKSAAKAEAPKAPAKSETQKSETKAAAVTPPPKAEAPKSEPKAAATPAPKPEAPKSETKSAAVAPAPKAAAPAPQAAAKPAPQEDFLSMVNKAIGTGSAPKPATSASEDEQIEQVSAANDLVQSVQVKLRERGFDPGSIDGRTNPKTVQAIRDYQQSVGMPADGLIDVALMERLGVVGKRLQFPGSR